MNSLLLFSFAGCECCGISSWYRESRLESLHDILMAAATQQQDLNYGSDESVVPVQAMGASVAEEAQQMVCCDECNEWVHSKCEGIDMSQYESIANGTHPVWVSDYCMFSDVTVLAII
jgi:hypothetical protein